MNVFDKLQKPITMQRKYSSMQGRCTDGCFVKKLHAFLERLAKIPV